MGSESQDRSGGIRCTSSPIAPMPVVDPGSTFTFVTNGIDSAIARPRPGVLQRVEELLLALDAAALSAHSTPRSSTWRRRTPERTALPVGADRARRRRDRGLRLSARAAARPLVGHSHRRQVAGAQRLRADLGVELVVLTLASAIARALCGLTPLPEATRS